MINEILRIGDSLRRNPKTKWIRKFTNNFYYDEDWEPICLKDMTEDRKALNRELDVKEGSITYIKETAAQLESHAPEWDLLLTLYNNIISLNETIKLVDTTNATINAITTTNVTIDTMKTDIEERHTYLDRYITYLSKLHELIKRAVAILDTTHAYTDVCGLISSIHIVPIPSGISDSISALPHLMQRVEVTLPRICTITDTLAIVDSCNVILRDSSDVIRNFDYASFVCNLSMLRLYHEYVRSSLRITVYC